MSMPWPTTIRGAGMVLAALLATSSAAVADDLARLQGAWITDAQGGGEPTTFTFKGRKLEVRSGATSYVLAIEVDEKARPEKTMDLKTESSSVPGAVGRTSPGIYRFEEESLILCLGLQGVRPSAFDTRIFDQLRFELWRTSKESAAAIAKAVEPAAADSDAPLPDGWPKVTKPGTIEVKTYPKYRSAIVREKTATVARGEGMFFALFGHITGKGVEMTAPVVMTYEPKIIENLGEKGQASMEFLYQHTDQGQAGPGLGKVKVEDHPAVTVVSLGVQGDIRPEQMRASVERLHGWLDRHKDEWVAAGPPRRLGYHGPMTPPDRRLNEVQIPVRPAH